MRCLTWLNADRVISGNRIYKASCKKVKCSVLILHGDKDAHIPPEDAQIFARAIRSNGNKDVTFKILKNHNHLFLEDFDGRKSHYIVNKSAKPAFNIDL